jgi:3-hydroxyisobutyrate dehydrogenase-like beta-hydroxyacid dehydrogenase
VRTGSPLAFTKALRGFDLSTNEVDVVRRLHASLAQHGVDFLDAPVSGGPSDEAGGALAIWVGGEKAVFDRYKPVLDTMSDQVHYTGASGTAGAVGGDPHRGRRTDAQF